MQDFIKIFIQEVVSTLEGLVGKAPSVGLEKEVSNSEEAWGSLISAPYARVVISAIEKEESSIELLAPVVLVTALSDLMLGGEGASKEEMDNDDLDAFKEMASNIFGAIATSLKSQELLPKLNFTTINAEIAKELPKKEDYAKAMVFSFKMEALKESQIILLTTAAFECQFEKTHKEEKEETTKSATAEEVKTHDASLENIEIRNISMLLDVKLNVKVRIGQKKMILKDVVSMDIGSVVELDQLVNDPLEILVDDKVIAKGEVVIVDGNFGIQITDIGTKKERLEQLKN
ncbi:putative flagellar motor switch protein [Helicobacter pylori CPY1662]|uniref:flagellar motor switch protein FliY n=1 Tax=Helicobacter pylori TaxID=210 RepID=UPI0002C48BB8|nr:flagellar motor switch protein FliY [Helicobacter pylori]EMR60778.1 putative flagellar motor switch protein [Helicobacter pylori CPY1662]WQY30083.1 flagellar motor switch protein FliY [Helicobacter pylori]WQY39942.1 flagellar motor switch protein FliY [Helicobacter pylori]WQZ36306.1 flagellar motor switch protein FliY [Helicobacter pylori]WQZ40527.1 flagellar motor switch protein FliY [Helicobacter pylori]